MEAKCFPEPGSRKISGKKLKDAVIYANYVGALATTKIGAQEALPTKEELEDFIKGL